MAEDLLEIERFLKNVRVVQLRLEVDGRTANPDDLDWLIETLEVDKQDVYFLDLTFIFLSRSPIS